MWMVIEPVLPSKASVDSSPGSPKQWSPCRWLMKMWFKRENFNFMRRISSWAPSPQSIIYRLSRTLSTWHEGKCMSDDVADPQPKIFSSNFVISIKKNIKQKV